MRITDDFPYFWLVEKRAGQKGEEGYIIYLSSTQGRGSFLKNGAWVGARSREKMQPLLLFLIGQTLGSVQ